MNTRPTHTVISLFSSSQKIFAVFFVSLSIFSLLLQSLLLEEDTPLSLLRSLIFVRGSMKRCVVYQGNVVAVCEDEMRMESVVCPKPRRLGVLNPSINDHSSRPLRCHQTDIGDSKSGSELLDMILTKGSYGAERSINQVASSPPYFCGSPPSRASNPVIQDALFGNEKLTAFSMAPPSPSSSSARKGGGCVRMKFGHTPAAVRIEGFDCLSRDRSNCSIYAVA